MINGAPLNSGPLNGASAAAPAPEPEYVVTGQAYVWRLRAVIGDADLSAQLTGTVEIDREEGAAGVAGLDLYLPEGPVIPPQWKGRRLGLDFISTSAGETVSERRFTGQISRADWNPVTRILSCECSDQRQQRVEAMSIEQIDALVGGYWSEDAFEPVEGRSHWDYALERLSTRPVSLDCSPAGELRVTSWFATAPHFVFGPGTTLYQTLELQESDLDSTTNRVEVELTYRYSRLWQLSEGYGWEHPNAGGLVGIGGFCAWRVWTTDLPTTEMVEDAVSANGQKLVGRVGGYTLPLSMANPCGDGNAWINTYDNLWLLVNVTGARRWVQTVTETYKLTLATGAGQADDTRIVQRTSYTISVESNRADEWVDAARYDGGSRAEDVTSEQRRVAAGEVALRAAQTSIIAAHRETTLSWDVPTPLSRGIDLVHTLEIKDQGAHAIGKCRRIVDRYDLLGGTAITTLSIASMQGGGVSQPLTLPARPDSSLPVLTGGASRLPTQLGGRWNDPETGLPIQPYDDTRAGFSGNYDLQDDLTAEDFPRRFDLPAREIPAEYRDERTATAERVYTVGIPNDLLEL
ncbi:hypothetical protein DN820_01765 [Stutzerimonas nosocomialis]|uniref:Uncharacterized protein n=1 Tax=Stutzerimonas nosocomialis TaxID=1056496 RepID=A0A5R9QJ49_9GAMM|nr:hypothetical protein DN820_01765 [Stutzerimonas nosocomialis]